MKQRKIYGILTGAILIILGIVGVFLTHSDAIAQDASASIKTIFAVSLILVVLGGVTAITAFLPHRTPDTRTLTMAAMFAALCYIGFTFFKIDIAVGMEKTAFHLGNVFCVLAALFLGGFWGGMAGAVGMTIADLTTAYVTSAPKTFLLKLCIGLITGLVAHKVFKISQENHSKRHTTVATILSCTAGMAFNVVADPLVGYFYKMYIMGVPQKAADAWAKMGAVHPGQCNRCGHCRLCPLCRTASGTEAGKTVPHSVKSINKKQAPKGACFYHRYLFFVLAQLTQLATGMTADVGLGSQISMLLQHNAQTLQHEDLSQDGSTGGAVQYAAFTVHTSLQADFAVLAQPGIGIAGNCDELAAVVADGSSSSLQFSGFAAVGDADDHVTLYQLTAGTMNSFSAVQVVGGSTGRREQRCGIGGNMTGLADTGDVQPVAGLLSFQDQVCSLLDAFLIDSCNDLLEFLVADLNKTIQCVHFLYLTSEFHKERCQSPRQPAFPGPRQCKADWSVRPSWTQ